MDCLPFMAVWSSFFLNHYRRWSPLALRNVNGTASFMYSRKSVVQGGQFSVLAYGIGVIPLTKQPKAAYPDVTQPWYVDDSSALSMFDNIGLYFNSLKHFGLDHGYYPKPSKIVLIVHLDNLAAGESFVLSHMFKVFTGARYMSGFIGDEKSKREWLKCRTSKWEGKFCAVTNMAGKCPQER